MLPRLSIGRTLRGASWQAAARRWSSTTTSFSVYGAGTKEELVERLSLRRPQIQNGQDAVVILASRPYASWLADEKFMAGLLETLTPSRGTETDQAPSSLDGPEKGMNVLAAVVEGLLPERRMAEARHGFSVYQGGLDVLLPELWTAQTDMPPPSTAKRGGEAKAALTFQTDWSLEGTQQREGEGAPGSAAVNPLTCTLPLANTVFQNQRPFTLFASRWRREKPGSPLQVIQTTPKQGQLVNCSADTRSTREATLFVPIGPVTPPRKILAGLGNIVRQVEIDAKPVPASRELEVAIQHVYDNWAEDTGEAEHGKGRVGVWAVVVPPGAATEASIERLDAWQKDFVAAKGLRPALEQAMSRSVGALAPLLVNGSRLYQVLSGGGGWGKKQGLLSLDPDTKFSAPGLGGGNGDEDLESFVRAFKNEHGSGGEGYGVAAGPFDAGVVAPGSVVQFFVAPTSMCELGSGPQQGIESDVHEAEYWTDGPSFGVTPRIPGAPTRGVDGQSWKVVEGTFGAVSSEAMYLSDTGGADAPGLLETKVNGPDSYLSRAR